MWVIELSLCVSSCSCYPAKRSRKDDKGVDIGVVGNVELVQNATLSTQPINSVDWSPDKVKMDQLVYCIVCVLHRKG